MRTTDADRIKNGSFYYLGKEQGMFEAYLYKNGCIKKVGAPEKEYQLIREGWEVISRKEYLRLKETIKRGWLDAALTITETTGKQQ